jgi:GTP-binding protein
MAAPPLPLEFVMSVTRADTLEPTPAEIAFFGRSNVGKSSIINAISNRKQIAKVSKTPGRTQTINLFRTIGDATVVDLPGYGFAKVPESIRSKWKSMINHYLLERENLRAVVLLIDAEVGPTGIDKETLLWLRTNNCPVHVVATKADKVRSAKREKRKNELAEGCQLERSDILWVSSANGVNIDELRGRCRKWLS